VSLAPAREVRAGPAGVPPRPSRSRLVVALVCGLVTVLGSLLLPLAPVRVADPVVTWPLAPQAPRSTLLSLEAGPPLGLSVRFSCRAVAAAAASGPAAGTGAAAHVLLATGDPDQPGRAPNLRILAESGAVTGYLGTAEVFRDVPPPGPCTYSVTTEAGRLVYARDGHRLGGSALPVVDALVTSVTALPGPADLAVTVRVDDRFASSPTMAKRVLTVLVALCGAVAAGCLARSGRRRPRRRVRRRVPAGVRVGVADAVVLATLGAWLFLAPMTHDDGWMYAMALNERYSGYFGNYYMYHDNSYVPFTWLLWIYSWWARVGVAPVLMRVPSLAFAVITWAGVRCTLARAVPGRRMLPVAVLFLAWWLPFGLGTRQEASEAACLTVAFAAAVAARRRVRPGYLGLAVGATALGIIAHPAGVTGLVPLVLGGPAAVRVIARTSRSAWHATATVLGVLSCAVVAGVAGFGGGTLDDLLRSGSSFGGSPDSGPSSPLGDELDRYRLLLGDSSLGSWALRFPVLVLLLALPLFALLCLYAWRARLRLPPALWLSGWSCAIGLLVLVATPSKWTWHFGAFAGLATIFLSQLALAAPGPLARLTRRHRTLAWGLGGTCLAGTAGWAWLAGQGRNWWADNLMPGVARAGLPLFGPVTFAAVLAPVLAAGLWRYRRHGPLALMWTSALLVGCLLAGEVGVLVGGFGLAVARTWDTWSPWTDAVRDPLARQCGEARVVRVADPSTAAAPPVATGPGIVAGATAGQGFQAGVRSPDSPPPPGPATALVYGSGPATPEAPARLSTPWLALPARLAAGEPLMTTVSGLLGGGNQLEAEFAAPGAGGPRVVARSWLGSPEDDLSWRDVLISTGAGLPPGTTMFRITATATHSWFSFASPTARTLTPVARALPRDGRTLVDWQLRWLYPCLDQPPLAHGIAPPVSYVVAFGFGPNGGPFSPTGGGTWTSDDGGLLGSQLRVSTMTRMYTVHTTEPGYPMRTVYRLTRALPDAAYRLRIDSGVAAGWRTPR
jgi:hypothetical protein